MAAPWDGRLVTYLGYGEASERPVTPNIAPGIMAVWFSTDTNELSLWADSAWEEDITGGGIPDAPSDGTLYGRKDADWEAVPTFDLDTYGADQGDILFRGSSAWESLSTDTSSAYGYVLTSLGGATNPAWSTPSEMLDTWTGGANGSLLMRGPTIWESLSPGVSGQILTTNGAGSPPSWEDAPSAGIPDAPSDGELYGRKDADWEVIPSASSAPFTLGWGVSAAPASSGITVFQYTFVEDVDFDEDWAGSAGFVGDAPANVYNFLIYKGVTLVGVVGIDLSGVVAFQSDPGGTSFVAGDTMIVVSDDADPDLLNVSVTFKGTRV